MELVACGIFSMFILKAVTVYDIHFGSHVIFIFNSVLTNTMNFQQENPSKFSGLLFSYLPQYF